MPLPAPLPGRHGRLLGTAAVIATALLAAACSSSSSGGGASPSGSTPAPAGSAASSSAAASGQKATLTMVVQPFAFKNFTAAVNLYKTVNPNVTINLTQGGA